MRVEILPSALNDLADGRSFYQQQNPGVGDYFLDSLFSDIDSLALYGFNDRSRHILLCSWCLGG